MRIRIDVSTNPPHLLSGVRSKDVFPRWKKGVPPMDPFGRDCVPTPEEVYGKMEINILIMEGISRLPKKEARLIMLCFYKSLSDERIASTMKISLEDVGRIRSNALGRLGVGLMESLGIPFKEGVLELWLRHKVPHTAAEI